MVDDAVTRVVMQSRDKRNPFGWRFIAVLDHLDGFLGW